MEHEKYFVLNAEGRLHLNRIHNLNCIEGLKLLPDNSIDCCVTSPPYFGLRTYLPGVVKIKDDAPECVIGGFIQKRIPMGSSYKKSDIPEDLAQYFEPAEIGLEETPEQYVSKMVEVFEQVRRVLKPEGTLWLNLGDSYAGSGGAGNQFGPLEKEGFFKYKQSSTPKNLKPKDLIGIPWMVAFALRANGWYLRQDIIWHKPNPMPESVTDRCTKSHEYIFLLTKSQKYYYDINAIRTPVKDSTVQSMMQQIENQKGSERVPGKTNGNMKAVGPGRTPRPGVDTKGGNQASETGIKAYSHRGTGDKKLTGHSGNFDSDGNLIGDGMANKRSVWTVTTKPFKEAHFATFPEDLIVDCIKAGCPIGGVVLDPFMGAGTTALVSRKLDRNYVGFELNKDYISIATKRLNDELGFFL